MDELHHECGVAAIYHLPNATTSRLAPTAGGQHEVSRLMPRVLLDLQNRGQLAAGFTTYNAQRDKLLDTYKQIGGVIEAFRLNHRAKSESIMREYAGRAAIGHVRYATCGATDRNYAQPFERQHGCKWKWFSFAFNGQLANFAELRDELLTLTDYHLTRDTDTEIIMHCLSHELRGEERPDLVDVFRNLSSRFDGAYNIVFMNAMGDMAIVRDPRGFRPMCYAQDGPLFAAASESVPLLNLGFREVRSLDPGQMILIQDGKVSFPRFAEPQQRAHCFFEWIYFASVASTLDERSVYKVRNALGKELARQEQALGRVPLDKDTIIVPVPDTGKAAADAMAFELEPRVPSVEGLIRNRYIGRTFIEGQNRQERVQLKYTPLREVLAGKRVLLIEDTIVRSTTMKSLVRDLRERGGAKEIHVRVACPPIVAPCFYGIDMSTVRELFAPRFMKGEQPTVEEQEAMAAELGADSLYYLPLDAIARCIGLPESQLCRACLTGEYPTETGERLYQLALRDRGGNGNGRTYELVAAAAQRKN
jgi:amidophosphoribosyltransferase